MVDPGVVNLDSSSAAQVTKYNVNVDLTASTVSMAKWRNVYGYHYHTKYNIACIIFRRSLRAR